MPIELKGVGNQWAPSKDIRRSLAESGQPVILSFSRGKDSLAAWLAMREDGMTKEQIHPIYFERVPGMKYTRESIKRYEEFFEQKITILPHPALYSQLSKGYLQPIERLPIIAACDGELRPVAYQELEDAYREAHGLDESAYACHGARAADGVARRTSMKKSGPFNDQKQKIAIIWDWTKDEVYDAIERAGIPLEEWSPDYKWFANYSKTGKVVRRSGRTFDGIAAQFLAPLKHYAPEDYEVVKSWFPLVDLELIRHKL